MHRALRLFAWTLPLCLLAAGVTGGPASAQPKPAPAKTAAAGKTAPPAVSASASASASSGAVSLPAPNPLETDSDKADKLYREAVEAGKGGDWQKAYELLIDAVRLKQSHDILGNLGTAEFKLNRFRDAAEHFTASLKLYPVNGRPEGKAFSQTLLDEARAQVGTLALKITPVTARVRVNGKEYAAADRDAVFVDAGEATVEVGGLPGYEATRKVVKVEKGREQTVTMELGPLGGSTGKPSLVLIGVGAGVAALAAGFGVGFAVAASGQRAEVGKKYDGLHASPSQGPCTEKPSDGLCKDLLAAGQRHDAFANTALGLFIGTGAVAATTAVYALVSSRKAPVQAGAVIGPKAAAFSIQGSF